MNEKNIGLSTRCVHAGELKDPYWEITILGGIFQYYPRGREATRTRTQKESGAVVVAQCHGSESQKTQHRGLENGCGFVVHLQLGDDFADMKIDRALRDLQDVGDLAGGFTVTGPAQHLGLPSA